MTGKRLFKVAEIAALIARVTGQHQSYVAQDISFAVQSDALPIYDANGRVSHWMAPGYLRRVDIYEVLDAFDYHPETQSKILAELDRPMQGAVVSNDASGTVKKWTPERVAEARAMQARLKAEGQKAFTAQTAAHYGVSAARLREVLKAESPTTKETQQEKAGPWDVLGT